MLTIHPPIHIRSSRKIGRLHEDFDKRIMGNYLLMLGNLKKEELLHLTMLTPELYMQEGDSVSVFHQVNHESTQQFKLDVINNLVNRILVANTENFCYQDSVYISTALRKLGITNSSSFMKQIFLLQEEKHHTHTLMQLYQDNRQLLRLLMTQQEEKPKKKITKKEEKERAEREKYFLHDQVYKRLSISKIYQDVRDFTVGIINSDFTVNKNEMQVSEQNALIPIFQLNELKQEIMNVMAPVTYFHANSYELPQDEENIENRVESKLGAAILLNLIDQTFSLRQEQLNQRIHNWYQIASSFFDSAANTWKRFEDYHTTNSFLKKDTNKLLFEVNQDKRAEVDLINQIAEETYAYNQELLQEKNELIQQTVSNIRQSVQQQEINKVYGSYHSTLEEMKLFYPEEEENTVSSVKQITEEEIRRQLEEINQRNIENFKKVTQITSEQPKLSNISVDKGKAKRDSIRALLHPEEVINEYLSSSVENHLDSVTNQVNEMYMSLLSEETKEIYRQMLKQKNFSQSELIYQMLEKTENEEMNGTEPGERNQETKTIELTTKELHFEKEKDFSTSPVRLNINEQIHEKLIYLREGEEEKHYLNFLTGTGKQSVKPSRKGTKNKKAVLEVERPTEYQLTLINKEFVKRAASENVVQMAEVYANRTIGLVHKEQERVLTEEIIEKIRQDTTISRLEESFEERSIDKKTITETQVNQQVNQQQIQQQNNMEELIQSNLKQQLSRISDQVYGKIEKRLQTERKRRGY